MDYVQRAVLSFSVPQPSILSFPCMTLTTKDHEWNYAQRAVLSFAILQPSILNFPYMTLTTKVHERFGGHYKIYPIFGD